MRQFLESEVIVVGGGFAGLSAAIYLGRAKRDTLVVDSGKSMARWEPKVENYLGFPEPVSGEELLRRARRQARRYHARFERDRIESARRDRHDRFVLEGDRHRYRCKRLLLATGIFHIPPDLPELEPCLGHSMFFCKDCDGFRVQGKTVAIYGWTNEAVEYALAMLLYSPCVVIVTDGREPAWGKRHATWVREYRIPVYLREITKIVRDGSQLHGLEFNGAVHVEVDALFTTRGDVYLNRLAKTLDAKINADGEIVTDIDMRTSVPGLYAAGCVTPANCQMIIAAGEGATAAQAINRDLFCESLETHSLRQFRGKQLRNERTRPTARKR